MARSDPRVRSVQHHERRITYAYGWAAEAMLAAAGCVGLSAAPLPAPRVRPVLSPVESRPMEAPKGRGAEEKIPA